MKILPSLAGTLTELLGQSTTTAVAASQLGTDSIHLITTGNLVRVITQLLVGEAGRLLPLLANTAQVS